MQFHFRQDWRELRRGEPGRRFQARYDRVHRENRRGSFAQRIILVILAIVFLVIGVLLTVMPGPAFLFFILAGGLLATESRGVARFMDASEVWARRVFAWGKKRWQRLSTPVRVMVLIAIAAVAAGAGVLGYRLFIA